MYTDPSAWEFPMGSNIHTSYLRVIKTTKNGHGQKKNLNLMSNNWHPTDFTHKVHFTGSACEHGCIMSSVALEAAFLSLGK